MKSKTKNKYGLLLALALFGCVQTGVVNQGALSADNDEEEKFERGGHLIFNKAIPLASLTRNGPFAKLADGSLFSAGGAKCAISKDMGRTWEEYPVFNDTAKFLMGSPVSLQTRKGTIIIGFSNYKERVPLNWDRTTGSYDPNANLPTYIVYSRDNGRTWSEPHKLHDSWTGMNREILETKDGQVVFSTMLMRNNPGRHCVLTYVSSDDGVTWTSSNILDAPAAVGDHGGLMEATVTQLKDGRLWMLIRTNWDYFYESYSSDNGLTWSEQQKTDIDASSAPGALRRLESGRLVLVWNRVNHKGKDEITRQGGDNRLSETPTSWQRDELSLMYSDDDGQTWSQPFIVAENKIPQANSLNVTGGIAYPHLIEQTKGILWITTGFGALKIAVREEDLPKPGNERLHQTALRLPPGDDNPRNSEGDFVTLKNGRILFIYSRYTGASSSDHAPAYLAGRFSDDKGKTWSQEDFFVLENEGGMNVMSVSLLRLKNGNIALFYLRKNSEEDCIPMMRISTDEAKTWSEPIACITDKKGYFVLNNNRVIQLKNGRLLLAVALHEKLDGVSFNGNGRIFAYYSDDNGATWHVSAEVANPSKVTAQEPGVIELKDGTIMMFIRASGGFQQLSYSKDKGQTWSPMVASDLHSPLSPASIARIPSTKDLLVVWNNNDGSNPLTAGRRTPLTVAISKDEGKTWQHVANVESNPNGWYCYIAIHFTKKDVLLGYCSGPPHYGGLTTTDISIIPQKDLYGKKKK